MNWRNTANQARIGVLLLSTMSLSNLLFAQPGASELLKLETNDIKITSIGNHTVGEHPQFLFVRVWQQGASVELAKELRYALDVQVGVAPPPSAGAQF